MNDNLGVGVWTPDSISRRGILKAGGAASLVAVLAACGSSSGKSSSGKSQAGSFKVGVDFSMTGLAGAYQDLLPNAKVAVSEINASGGVLGKKLELVIEDNQSSPANDPPVITKFQSGGVKYILGPPGSSDVQASLTVTTPNKMLQSGWGDDVVFGDGSKYPYFYQVVYSTEQEVSLYVDYMVKTRKLTKLAILQENSAFGSSATSIAKTKIKEAGATLTDLEVFPQDVADLQVQVAKAKASGAQALLTFIAPLPTMTTMARALVSAHWTPPIAGHDLVYTSLLQVLPPAAANDVATISYAPLTYTSSTPIAARQANFAKKLSTYPEVKKIGAALVIQAPHYDWLHLLKLTIEQAKTFDTSDVKAKLDKVTNYQGMLGPMSFTPSNHTGPQDAALTLGILGSLADSKSQSGYFLRRATGL